MTVWEKPPYIGLFDHLIIRKYRKFLRHSMKSCGIKRLNNSRYKPTRSAHVIHKILLNILCLWRRHARGSIYWHSLKTTKMTKMIQSTTSKLAKNITSYMQEMSKLCPCESPVAELITDNFEGLSNNLHLILHFKLVVEVMVKIREPATSQSWV